MRRVFTARGAGSVALALTLGAVTACGSSGPGDSAGEFEVWSLEDEVLNQYIDEGLERFNEDSEVKGTTTYYANDPYKQRLQVAMGSPNAPDVFFNWGGGNLGQYVDAGQVLDMTDHLDENPEFRDSFVPSVLEAAELDGKNYGVPITGVQPGLLFYNKQVFEDVGVEPPETYQDLLDLVDTFKEEDITPIVLPGAQAWTELMWVSYLVERVGGPEVFQAISNNEEGAWSDPAVTEALEMCRDLVERGAFGGNFSSVEYDGGAASTLLAEGEGAMFLMGTWEIQTQLDQNPDFVESGDLGFTTFPAVEGGEGDPKNIVGPPSNFFSVNANSDHKEAALEFLTETFASDEYVDGLIDSGAVPAVTGIEDKLEETEHPEFTTFTHELVSEAPTFTPAWDQDLDPSTAEAMLTNFQLVFGGEMAPEEFAPAMGESQ